MTNLCEKLDLSFSRFASQFVRFALKLAFQLMDMFAAKCNLFYASVKIVTNLAVSIYIHFCDDLVHFFVTELFTHLKLATNQQNSNKNNIHVSWSTGTRLPWYTRCHRGQILGMLLGSFHCKNEWIGRLLEFWVEEYAPHQYYGCIPVVFLVHPLHHLAKFSEINRPRAIHVNLIHHVEKLLLRRVLA